jgi:hypothetical protein
MNHKNTTLAIAAIVAAVAMTTAAFAIPQQALAGGHIHTETYCYLSPDRGKTLKTMITSAPNK